MSQKSAVKIWFESIKCGPRCFCQKKGVAFVLRKVCNKDVACATASKGVALCYGKYIIG